MPIAPPPVAIAGQTSWQPADYSGVAYDYTKLSTMPSSLYETDGYRERLGENGWEVERVWRCNWSDLAAAMQWFYGYSFMTNQRSLNSQLPSPNGEPAPPQGGNAGGAGSLSRVIPAQDVYRPYLYADHVELLEGAGAFVQDPGLFLKDINGGYIDLAGAPVGGGAVLRAGGAAPLVGVGPQPGARLVANAPPPAPIIDPEGRQPLPGMIYAELSGPGPIGQGVAGNFSDGVATLRVTYRQRPYVVRNDQQNAANPQGELGRYVEREPKYAIQGIPLYSIAKQGQLYFVGTTTPVPEAGVMLVPTVSWRYTHWDLPYYPSAAIAACVGCINRETFDGVAGFPAFDPGTLLCQAPEISWRRNACGQVAFRVTWILDHRSPGWNYFPQATGGFALATFGGGQPAANGSNLVFTPADFSQLFQVGEAFAFL